MSFFSSIRNDSKKTHKQNFVTHPVPGQSHKFVCVYVFSSGVEKLTGPVYRAFQTGPFLLIKWVFCKKISPLGYKIF